MHSDLRTNLHKIVLIASKTKRLRILNPTFGDYIMDVLTGGGLGDLLRKWIFGEKQYDVENEVLISLGFRRLLFNPNAPHNDAFFPKESYSLGRDD